MQTTLDRLGEHFALPYFEQNNLHNQIDFDLPGFAVENLQARETSIDIFICPTDNFSPNNFVVRNESSTPVEQLSLIHI